MPSNFALSADLNRSFMAELPVVPASAFVAHNATLVGAVELGEECSVWYGAVLRGDINRIVVGARSNIQDGAIVHLADDFPALIGQDVTVGHRAILHACTVEDEVLIGMGATVLDGARIGAQSVIGAGALVTGGKEIPPGSLVVGAPARVVRTLTPEERAGVRTWAEKYVKLSRLYLQGVHREYRATSQGS